MMSQSELDLATNGEARYTAAVLYEDFLTGLRAHFLTRRIHEALGVDGEPGIRLWRFDVLHAPELFKIAVEDSLSANLVMLSAHGGGIVPDIVKGWLCEWILRKRDSVSCMIVSLDAVAEKTAARKPFLLELHERLRSSQVECLPCFLEPPEVKALAWRRQIRGGLSLASLRPI